MPVDFPDYRPPLLMRSGHLNTIVGARLRTVPRPAYQRERISTGDGDFLDIDWALAHGRESRAERAVIVSHGLEGSSDRTYVRSIAHVLTEEGSDVAAWNFRGCSGEPNNLLRSYHSGATDDLRIVIAHLRGLGYERIDLVGFSLGGNLTLKYLGEEGASSPVERAVALSVPCDLTTGIHQIEKAQNKLYAFRFLRSLREKYRQKARTFPDALETDAEKRIRTIRDFDELYTAPVHGFESAAAYYAACSSIRFIDAIRVPTLILNALDDPFLTPECTPHAEAAANPVVRLLAPRDGGHIGFMNGGNRTYAESCTATWLRAASP